MRPRQKSSIQRRFHDNTPAHQPIDSRDIQAAIDKLKRFYASGALSRQKQGARIAYGSLKAVGTTSSIQEHIRKARVFADPVNGYSPDELDRLISQCRRAGFFLGPSHIIRLLAIPKGPKRDEFQAKAIARRWSRIQLNIAISKKFGNRKPTAGRRPRPLTDFAEAKLRIAELCSHWIKLWEEIGELRTRLAEKSSSGRTPRFDPRLKKQLELADKVLKKLRRLAEPTRASDKSTR